MPRKISPAVNLGYLPYPDFPLRRHANGQWFKSIWNRRSKKSEQFYFGPWADDPNGERAIKDPNIGWLVRREAIKAGIDNVRVQVAPSDLTLGELMTRFLDFKRGKVASGELSLATLDGYLKEVTGFVMFQKPATPAGGLRPEHFAAFNRHLVVVRKLGRFARKRVITYINTFLRYGAKNGWMVLPSSGVDWIAPTTDPDAMRVARARAGIRDDSERLVSGDEIDKLLVRAQPAFRAMILLGINCGLGAADLGRLRWNMIDVQTGRLTFPRPKTGVKRAGYLWHKTRDALQRVRMLRHNLAALSRDGDDSLVFITRKNLPYYREEEVHGEVEVNGVKVRKLLKIKVDNAILRTFRRMVRELHFKGLTFCRLRHSFRTYGQRARDREALDLCMGHKDQTIGKIYNHEEVSWKRIRRIAKVVYRRLWPKVRHLEDTMPRLQGRRSVDDGAADVLAA